MANSSDDLEAEISRLWAKVASSPAAAPEAAPVAESSNSSDMAWETVSLLKRQHTRQTRTWAEVLESKEQALKVYRERQAALEAELGGLRQKLRSGDDRVFAETLEVQGKMQDALKTLEAQRAQADEELRSMKSLLTAARDSAGAEHSRWRAEELRWEKKEQQYLLDMRELQALTERYQKDGSKAEDQAARLSDSLREAKNALEKTLAELLRERRIRSESEDERAKALKKVDEVEKHFAELSKIWEEERSQWRELWDRERSTWETQRAEFAAWEDNLRKEREAWHSEMASKDKDRLEYAEHMTRSLRESSETSSQLADVMKKLSGLEGRTALSSFPVFKRAGRGFVLAAVVVLAAVLAGPVWRYSQALRLKPISAQNFPLDNPTAMTYDGSLVWVSQWDGKLLAYDPQDTRKALRSIAVTEVKPYHPTGLAFGGGALWSLDTAQARIVKHDPLRPDKVLHWRPAPGPAPTALAYDGHALWSYDAANKSLYRHNADAGGFKAFAIDQDMVPTAMHWAAGRLWLFDSKGRRVRTYGFKDEVFQRQSELVMSESVIGMVAVDGDMTNPKVRQLWVLAGPSVDKTGNLLIKYRY